MSDLDRHRSMTRALPMLADAMLFRARIEADAQILRIVWTGRGSMFTYYVPLREKPSNAEWPDYVLTDRLRERLAPDYAGEDALVIVSNHEPSRAPGVSLSKEAKKRRAWILPLVSNPATFFQLLGPDRGPLIAARAKELTKGGDKVSRQTLGDWIRRYMMGGMDFSAMEDDPSPRGGVGQQRDCENKPGAPRTNQAGNGTPVNQQTRPILATAAAIYFAEKCSLVAALAKANDLLCSDWEPQNLLTVRQLQHYIDTNFTFGERLRKRVGMREFNLKYRRFDGTVEVYGPGARFQIDATVADIYLVSVLNRERVVGRPTMYLVSDVFSRLIVGFHVTFAPPSYFGAVLAMESVVQSKVALCHADDIEISEADWPAHHLPARIQGDGGSDVTATGWDYLEETFNTIFETTAPCRGDWKAIVEGHFNWLPATWGDFLPGYIDTDYKPRGGRDSRLDATFTLPGFRKWMLLNILKYINRPIQRRMQSPEMLRQKIAPTPVEWWNYGVASGNFTLKIINPDALCAAIYPRAQATVTHRGIEFLNRCYETPRAIAEDWLERARVKSFKVTVAYDPSDPRKLFVIHVDGPPERATPRATGAQWEFSISQSEIRCFEIDAKRNLNDAKDNYVYVRRRHDKAAAKVLAEEKALRAAALREAGRKKPDIADMSGAKQEEREIENVMRTGFIPSENVATAPIEEKNPPLADGPKDKQSSKAQSGAMSSLDALRALREASKK
ncbi:Mu transposase C-terminal domain-containing protein [Cupriavidus necator]